MAECALDDYYAGDWDGAVVGATEYFARRGGARYMDSAAHYLLAVTASARGEDTNVQAHADPMLEHGREAAEAQVLLTSLSWAAQLAFETGALEVAHRLVDELATALSTVDRLELSVDFVPGFAVASILGRGSELAPHLGRAVYDSPWVRVCAHIVDGSLDDAGDLLEAHDAVAYAALARLYAAEREGRETPGLRQAIASPPRAALQASA